MVDVNKAHNLCSNHKGDILKSDKCGCFYCFNIFLPDDITEWVDGNNTALCPKCGIDAVLPSSKIEINVAFLKEMGVHWFNQY